MAIRIGVVGDFNPDFPAHTTTNDALAHSAEVVGRSVEVEWIPTPSLVEAGGLARLGGFDGLWISAGSPYRQRDGAFAAIRFARERGRPMVAT